MGAENEFILGELICGWAQRDERVNRQCGRAACARMLPLRVFVLLG